MPAVASRADDQRPPAAADRAAQEWVWDAGVQLWGGWHWDVAAAQWMLVEVRRADDPGEPAQTDGTEADGTEADGTEAAGTDAAQAAARRVSAYVTAYTWYDNTPNGSARISHPVLHRSAGGTGRYADPVTVAVGHSKASGRDVLDWAPGTRFYFPRLRVYGIVEDTCGDGPTPQLKPCHRLDTPGNSAPAGARTWLDVWIDGRDAPEATVRRRAGAATGLDRVVVNPGPGLPVRSGPVGAGLG